MRILPLIISVFVTAGLIVILNSKLVLPAPLGKLLSPQHGVWQNAEKAEGDFNADLKFPGLKGKVQVYFDERLVPHVFAEQENDAYFVQGYLHGKFRLWQMELQTHAAAGRASEIIGVKALKHDREFRRLGMGYAAEIALKEMEADPEIKSMCDAYTAGVNAYIKTLTEGSLPVEYKLIGYTPEPWTNLKTALFLKYMSYDLAGHDDDFEMTNAKNYFSKEDFDLLYPAGQDSLDPIIPKGTVYAAPKIPTKAPAAADSLYFKNNDLLAFNHDNPDRSNGSNNWAVSGSKTQSGAPILCNDPHLGLNLPSLWYEMQISTPSFNAYGVSFPGAPAVIIGYNDSSAFGFTNGGRDVKDYYKIQFKDDTRKEYWFNNEWKQTEFRVERIKIKDSVDYVDTVAYTLFGPVMYDKSFGGDVKANRNYYALRWTAHDPSNEMKMFYLLNRAKNYADYNEAVINLRAPGQNCAFACKSGDIAIRTQGNWPAKWRGQGDFIMPGTDSSFMWQGMIPMDETPAQYNPERGFISSANQKPADTTYPYYLGRDYPLYRGLIINKKLAAMQSITAEDMMALQTTNENIFAEEILQVFLKNIKDSALNASEKKYLEILKNWDLKNDPDSKGATVFSILWSKFDKEVFDDEFKNAPPVIMHPFESTLLEAALKDSAWKFFDNTETTQKETLHDVMLAAFKTAVTELKDAEISGKLEWAKYKATRVSHLAKLDAFSRLNLPIGGGTHCINATKETHGPSWRMVVSLTPETAAYGVYPGGQSGNPGSKFYDTFIDKWVQGKYYSLWMMKKDEVTDKRIKWKMSFSAG
ncbi:MAG: penicillin acylase family protein [Ferruginibacter sp.]